MDVGRRASLPASRCSSERICKMIRERGRPATFDSRTRKYFARLIQRHGVRGARTASKVPVSQHTLTKVAREFGIPLLTGRRPSDPSSVPRPKFTSAQKEQLQGILAAGPIAAGYRSDRWTCRRITDVVHRSFGIKCHPIHLRGVLPEFGFRFVERQIPQMRSGESVAQIPVQHSRTAETRPAA